MRRAFVVLLLIATPASAGLRSSSIVPPDGWVDDSAAHIAKLDGVRALGVVRVDLQSWTDGTSTLGVLEMVSHITGSARSMIEAHEKGARNATKAWTQVSLVRREEDLQLLVDETLELGEQRIHMIRRYAVSEDGDIHYSTATCGGPRSAPLGCESALATFKLRIDHAIGLDEIKHGTSTRIAYLAGYVAVPVAGLVWLLVFLFRRSKRTR